MTDQPHQPTPYQPGPSNYPPAAPPPAAPAGTPRRRPGVLIGVAVAVLAVIAGAAGAWIYLSGGGELAAAREQCAAGNTAVVVADGGNTLVLTLPATAENGRLLGCVLEQLQAPVAVRQHIGTTKGVEGRQTGEWDGYKAAWSVSRGEMSLTIEAD